MHLQNGAMHIALEIAAPPPTKDAAPKPATNKVSLKKFLQATIWMEKDEAR